MKQFVKFVFASCLGTFLALGLVILLFMSIGLSSVSTQKIAKNSLLELNLDQLIPELTNNVSQDQFAFTNEESIGLNDIRKLIRKAAGDDQISGILIRTENTALNPTVALEISKLIKEFSDGGKFVEAYGNYFTQSGYLIASNADSIFLNPNGLVDLRGYGYTIPYFKDFSEKSEINFDVYHAGQYKSAIEPFYLDKSSDANRSQTHSFLNEYQNTVIDVLSQNRGIEPSGFSKIIVEGLSNNSEDASSLGLVDEISYWEEYEERLKRILDVTKVNYVSLAQYYAAFSDDQNKGNDKIAIVYAEGDIAFGGKTKGQVSMERYAKMLDRIKNNDKIKAVVLRVNSPGGSSITSDLFWKKVEDIKKSGKYVVASFGTYAASGGYYISCGADKIVSEPTTLTGSIGVFAMIPDMSKFFDEKIGIDWDTIGTGRRTFMYSTMVPRNQYDHDLLTRETERTYALFKQKVADGRNLSAEQVEEIAQGRVWSGNQALEVGLVDTIGDLDVAIEMAARAVELEEYKILEYPIITKTFYEELVSSLMESTDVHLSANQGLSSSMARNVAQLIDHVESVTRGPQARLPFILPEY